MRYWVYGLDAISKEPRQPVTVESDSEDGARRQAAEMGMLAQAIEPAEVAKISPGTSARSFAEEAAMSEPTTRGHNVDITTRSQRAGGARGLFLLLACALLIGFVGGRSVAESAGVLSPGVAADRFGPSPDEERAWVAVARVLLAFFTWALGFFLLHLGQRTISVLAQTQARPSPAVALTLIGCGTLCLLAAVALQWQASSASATVSTSMPNVAVRAAEPRDVHGGMPMPAVVAQGGQVSVRASTSLMVPVTTFSVLLAGAVFVSLGVWSGIPART